MKKIYISLFLILIIIISGTLAAFANEAIFSQQPTNLNENLYTQVLDDWTDDNREKDQYGLINAIGQSGDNIGNILNNDREEINPDIIDQITEAMRNQNTSSGNGGSSPPPFIGPSPDPQPYYSYTPKHEAPKIASYWYIYDRNSKETERDFVKIWANDPTKFTHTFDKLGSYVIQRIDAYSRFDWQIEHYYVPYLIVNINPVTLDVNISWDYRLESSRSIVNNLSSLSTALSSIPIVAANGANGGVFTDEGSMYLQDGNTIYRRAVLNPNNKWYVHITEVPFTWTEGDGDTGIGGHDVDAGLTK